MFKERNTKLTLLSLLSALVVASTAFAGVSIYAQQADDNMTSTEDSGLAGNATSLDSSADDSSDDSSVDASETSTAASIADLFSGLVICDLGTLTVGDATEVAADANGTQPTITITVMDRTEIASAADNETSTAASSADCMELGDTSTSNTTESTDSASDDNATSTTTSSNETSTSNATSVGEASIDDEELTTFEEEALTGNESGNATSAANATDTSSNATSTASDASADEGQVVAIDGKDFAPGQVVLVFTDNALVAVDDVDSDGSIDAKVPMEDVDSELRFVESGTMRTATASFAEDDTVIAGSEDQDILIVMAGDSEDTETASSFPSSNSTSTSNSNATSTNNTSTNSTNATGQ